MSTHECPGAGCYIRIDSDELMCRKHWYMVPKVLRTRVWQAWDNGNGAGTDKHEAAISAAIKSIGGGLAAW